jgi:hypothetical protein
MIAHLSYVICDRCDDHPAQPGEDAAEARGIARTEGYTRQNGQDVCGRCSGTIDAHGIRVIPSGKGGAA